MRYDRRSVMLRSWACATKLFISSSERCRRLSARTPFKLGTAKRITIMRIAIAIIISINVKPSGRRIGKNVTRLAANHKVGTSRCDVHGRRSAPSLPLLPSQTSAKKTQGNGSGLGIGVITLRRDGNYAEEKT